MKDYGDMLRELFNDDSDTMSEWEIEFLDSLNWQRSRFPDWSPSEKQFNVLQRIWDKVFA